MRAVELTSQAAPSTQSVLRVPATLGPKIEQDRIKLEGMMYMRAKKCLKIAYLASKVNFTRECSDLPSGKPAPS